MVKFCPCKPRKFCPCSPRKFCPFKPRKFCPCKPRKFCPCKPRKCCPCKPCEPCKPRKTKSSSSMLQRQVSKAAVVNKIWHSIKIRSHWRLHLQKIPLKCLIVILLYLTYDVQMVLLYCCIILQLFIIYRSFLLRGGALHSFAET